MKRIYLVLFTIAFCTLSSLAQTADIVYTTDVHGQLFSFDFVKGTESDHSLAQVATYIEEQRASGKNPILLDAGDMLQGTPVNYYYNNIDTAGTNIIAKIYNYLKYDAVCIGNHDIEASHRVYDKLVKEMEMPILAANAINIKTGEPYFKPYTILEREGKRIAVLGITTPYIPNWLPKLFWEGIKFGDMVETAEKWVKVIKETEKADAIIGLFHAGADYTYGGQNADTYCNENASVLVAQRVEGFDAILIGHDHKTSNQNVKSPSGKTVPVIDAGVGARYFGHIELNFNNGKQPEVKAQLLSSKAHKPSEAYYSTFRNAMLAVNVYAKKIIAKMPEEIISSDALFGPNPFVDLIHDSMRKYTGAQISMTAPLLIDAIINKGDLSIGNMFSLYRFENSLCLLSLTGKEVKDYLEFSYDYWVNSPDETGHLLNMNKRNKLVYKYFNFDSANGINYTVNPYKPKGERVEITSLENGEPFNMEAKYTVAVNSYRHNGGGGHLTQGLGFTKEQIEERTLKVIPYDLRGLVMKDFEEMGDIKLPKYTNWKFEPADKLEKYIEADKLLFKLK